MTLFVTEDHSPFFTLAIIGYNTVVGALHTPMIEGFFALMIGLTVSKFTDTY